MCSGTGIHLSVIVVSYNTLEILKKCLAGLLEGDLGLEVFVVDNASSDGTSSYLEETFRNEERVRVILNETNRGFSFACNQPIPACRGRYVLFLNPDAFVSQCSLREMLGLLDRNPGVGVVGPRLVYEDGRDQVSFGRANGPIDIIVAHAMPLALLRQLRRIRLRAVETDVAWVSGACLMMRVDLARELEGFDERIFLSLSDCIDLCRRVTDNGKRVVFFPGATVVHLSGPTYEHPASWARVLAWAYEGYLHYCQKHYGETVARRVCGAFALVSVVKAAAGSGLSLFGSKRLKGKAAAHLLVASGLAGRLFFRGRLHVPTSKRTMHLS